MTHRSTNDNGENAGATQAHLGGWLIWNPFAQAAAFIALALLAAGFVSLWV